MKKYLMLISIVAVPLLLLWMRPAGRNSSSREMSEPMPRSAAPANSNSTGSSYPTSAAPELPLMARNSSVASPENEDSERVARLYKEIPDVPVAFYGLVVDHDSNALQNVNVDLELIQWDVGGWPEISAKMIQVKRQTGADGRFEVSGLNGHYLTVRGFAKEGYEPETMRSHYG
jgi:hypothetical protein